MWYAQLMKLHMYQVDAFCRGPFTGNPAAVVPLTEWPDDGLLQNIAIENNLSETAYIIKKNDIWELRWFTPGQEVALCGHATLGAAHAICEHIEPDVDHIVFRTRQSGDLIVDKTEDGYQMSFPAITSSETDITDDMTAAIGAKPDILLKANYTQKEFDLLAVFDSQKDIERLAPDLEAVKALGRGLIVTAPARDSEFDFVSRFFAPAVGVPEDPATGSAHCVLTPYWSDRLGKTKLSAKQISERGGYFILEHHGDRVNLSGNAHTYLIGDIFYS